MNEEATERGRLRELLLDGVAAPPDTEAMFDRTFSGAGDDGGHLLPPADLFTEPEPADAPQPAPSADPAPLVDPVPEEDFTVDPAEDPATWSEPVPADDPAVDVTDPGTDPGDPGTW